MNRRWIAGKIITLWSLGRLRLSRRNARNSNPASWVHVAVPDTEPMNVSKITYAHAKGICFLRTKCDRPSRPYTIIL